MIIYIDENMSPFLARGFNILQKPENIKQREDIEIKSIKDEFGQGVQDEDWIPIAGEQGACILTQDYNINRIKHQRALCEEYNLGMFYFRPPSKGGFNYWNMVKLMVKHWPEIVKIASKNKKPFSFKVTSKSSHLENMDDDSKKNSVK